LTAAQDAVMEFERWGHENPGPMPLGAAWADCLFGYCLSHPDSGERGVREHKSLAYCAKGVLELADWVGRNGAREPMLLWALELLAETLANLGEPETAYLLRLEMHHKRIADVARVQALFNLAVAL